MACDLSLCFLAEGETPVESIARSEVIRNADADTVYLVVGSPRPASAQKSFFGLWADGAVDLPALALELSSRAPVCLAWKAEHGGVGGYIIYREGNEVANVADSGAGYLLLPSRGVELAFGVTLGLTEDERLMFPELLLDDGVSCLRIENKGAHVEAASGDTITALLENDLEAEPVLPVDVS